VFLQCFQIDRVLLGRPFYPNTDTVLFVVVNWIHKFVRILSIHSTRSRKELKIILDIHVRIPTSSLISLQNTELITHSRKFPLSIHRYTSCSYLSIAILRVANVLIRGENAEGTLHSDDGLKKRYQY
uniref:Uncharacterized protein n=1 Tax=Ciona intestinalis TaxID=7719 RepID=H2XMC9_CIOIN